MTNKTTRKIIGIILFVAGVILNVYLSEQKVGYHDLLSFISYMIAITGASIFGNALRDAVELQLRRDFKLKGETFALSVLMFLFGVWITAYWDQASVHLLQRIAPFALLLLLPYGVYSIVAFNRELSKRRHLLAEQGVVGEVNQHGKVVDHG